MNTVSAERLKELEAVKELVKERNIDAIAQLLTDLQDTHQEIKNEQVDLKRILTNLTQDIVELKAQINMLKAMGFRGNTGTGSTVHAQGE